MPPAYAAIVFAGFSGLAQAQGDYPTKPVKIIVAFPPGGTIGVARAEAAGRW
jgi:tripartite-type tricarboxylate transporter receptor subunit TctC